MGRSRTTRVTWTDSKQYDWPMLNKSCDYAMLSLNVPLTSSSIVFFLPFFFFYPSSSFLLIFCLFFFHFIFRFFSFTALLFTSICRYLLHHIVFDVINRSVSTRRCLLRSIFFIVVSVIIIASSSSYLIVYVVLFVHLINTIFIVLRRAMHYHCISLYILVTAYHVVFGAQARCPSRISFLNPEPPNYIGFMGWVR